MAGRSRCTTMRVALPQPWNKFWTRIRRVLMFRDSGKLSSRAEPRFLRRSRGTPTRRGTAGSAVKVLLVAFIAFGLAPLHAAELANLRNGFSLRHDHHEVVGTTTRLYMSADPAAGYVDVPTDQIEGYEPAPPDPQDSPA